ncbi:MAG TPA: ABC transporter permease [Thermotogota bacterium]|nr:ABC transporter permease [Thermotogota bacterium]
MQVFKAYFKIIKKNLPMLSIYMIIFMAVAIGTTSSNQTNGISNFTEAKSRIALINEDSGSAFSDGLEDYIRKNTVIVNIEDEEEALRDALFFEKINYILRIPEGFSDDFMNGRACTLEETQGLDKTSGIFTETLLNKFLNIASLYAGSGMTQAETVEKTLNDLSLDTTVIMKNFDSGLSDGQKISYFFNSASYSLTIIVIFAIATFMLIFNQSLIKHRTLCSPLSQNRVSAQILLANLCLAIAVWGITMICGLVMYGTELFTLNGFLWGLNLFIFSLVALSISFFAGNVIKSRQTISAVANTIALGFSFICGAFVPQNLLGPNVLSFARFLPTYWYIRASNQIGTLKTFSGEAGETVIIAFLIQLGFFAAIMAVSLVISKQRRVESLA